MDVSIGEPRRRLRAHGCTFEESKKHTMVRLGGRSAMMPRHPSKEIAIGTLNAILRQLGLKGK
jgi:predicted RNA binding protein YcfA (HicA-like mRNA interferase family)